MNDNHLLVWRDTLSTSSQDSAFETEADLYGVTRKKSLAGMPPYQTEVEIWRLPDQCPFCGTTMQYGDQTITDNNQFGINQYDKICIVCHYQHKLVDELWHSATDMRMELGAGNIKKQWLKRPVLKSLDLNDASVAFDELGSWLAAHPEQIYNLNPRRFEEIVADVFRSGKGFEVRLTQASKDGGIDVYLLEKDGTQAIVQVKRYRSSRKIGVELIDQVRGLKLRPVNHDVTKAYIVTSSSFTRGAKELAANPPLITKLDLELIDCERFLRELSCYGGGVGSLPKNILARLRQR